MTESGEQLEALYRHRFPERELARKQAIWQVLCRRFFSRYVQPSGTVVDIGAGYCEFINNIPAAQRIAVDLNPEVKRFAAPGVRVINESCTAVRALASGSVLAGSMLYIAYLIAPRFGAACLIPAALALVAIGLVQAALMNGAALALFRREASAHGY